ncbi:MAG: DUF1559 domain-containing protein [Planctomycetes bacterium]|nr:DUF1559 domain-containing protein [Planctomycetota bacterium]
MSIRFACACGQELTAREEFVGQRVKCSVCGEVQTVPGEAGPSPARAPAPAFIRFHCSCGQACQAKTEYAGRNTRCPRCSTILTIPAGGITAEPPAPRHPAALQADEPVRSSTRRSAPEEDDLEANRLRRRRSVKKSKRWVWLTAAAVLLLAGGGLGLWLLLRSGTSSDFDLVPRDAQGFVTLRVADILDSPLGKKLFDRLGKQQAQWLEIVEKKIGLSLKDIERVTTVCKNLEQKEIWVIIQTTKACDKDKILSAMVGAEEKSYDGKKYYHNNFSGTAIHFYSRRVMVLGEEKGLKACLDLKSPKSGPLDEALKAASKSKNQFAAAINLPSSALADARKKLSGKQEKYRPLLELTTAYAVAAIKEDIEWELGVDFPDKDKARDAEKVTNDGLQELKKELANKEKEIRDGIRLLGLGDPDRALDQTRQFLEQLTPRASDRTVSLNWKVKGTEMLEGVEVFGKLAWLDAVNKVRQSAVRTQAQNNFRQIVIAMQDYADNHQGQLPPAIIRHPQTKKPLYSWRVALLPYLEQNDLYKKLKLDEPWDSPHNRLLLQTPKVYQMPSAQPEWPGQTFIQVFTGPGTPFNGEQGPRLPASFPDGMSQTILIAESKVAVHWAAPQDIVYNKQGSPRRFLGNRYGMGPLVGMADGVARFVGPGVSDETLRRAIDPADGLPLGPDWNQ